ncbi:MAG: hypothetical protein M1833_003669 [Piccolia ochrophora]|nr:MAG: hypothetical protein M1833_003669 [Piccolia ochrophora]
MYTPKSLWTWSFILLSIVQAAIVIGFESYVFAVFQTEAFKIPETDNPDSAENQRPQTIPTYLTLFIFGFLYQIVLAYDALRLKNTIQIIGLCFYNLALLIYGAVQIDQIKDAVVEDDKVWGKTHPFLVAIPCVVALITVVMSGVAWKLYDEFAWTIYKHISADLRMKRRFLTYQIYIALLKFDFFFFLGFTVQFVVIVLGKARDKEFYITIAAIPVTILILVLAAYWTRTENRFGMALILSLYVCGLAYFSFKLGRMYDGKQRVKYRYSRKSLTTFAVITLILLFLTIVNACVCTYNFGRGLKPHIARRKLENEDEKATTELPNYGYGQAMPSRMTID